MASSYINLDLHYTYI